MQGPGELYPHVGELFLVLVSTLWIPVLSFFLSFSSCFSSLLLFYRFFLPLLLHVKAMKIYRFLQFVAHPNVQQLLASIWYEGLPGFRRKNMVLQALEIVRIGLLFPIFSVAYIIAPHSVFGQTMRKPFIKFICHSASYFTFLCE